MEQEHAEVGPSFAAPAGQRAALGSLSWLGTPSTPCVQSSPLGSNAPQRLPSEPTARSTSKPNAMRPGARSRRATVTGRAWRSSIACSASRRRRSTSGTLPGVGSSVCWRSIPTSSSSAPCRRGCGPPIWGLVASGSSPSHVGVSTSCRVGRARTCAYECVIQQRWWRACA